MAVHQLVTFKGGQQVELYDDPTCELFPAPTLDQKLRWEAEWMTRHGLRASTGHVCVRALALGRCRAYQQRPKPGCSMFSRVFDHASMYIYQGKPACIVGHEYAKGTGDSIWENIERWTERWPQLEFRISGASWHYPGKTFLVILYNSEVLPEGLYE